MNSLVVMMLCFVDAKNIGFQCAYKDLSFFLSFDSASPLECQSQDAFEVFIKTCKKPIDSCTVDTKSKQFDCENIKLSYQQADTYVCISPYDKTRVVNECLPKNTDLGQK